MTKLNWLYTGWRRLAAAIGSLIGLVAASWFAILWFQNTGIVAAPIVIAAGVCGAVIGWFTWPIAIPVSLYGAWWIFASLASVAAKHA
jgi:hypothetical protein